MSTWSPKEPGDHARPLRAMFLLTSMPVGGQEMLLYDLVRSFDRCRIKAEIGCLKERGQLGSIAANEVPVHDQLLRHKWDFGVLARLQSLYRERAIDAVVTVGCGDKMFWGRLAAWQGGVPVVVSALHSTGWPDRVGWLNRQLTLITDAFVAVAQTHGAYLVQQEGLPQRKVAVIPNGVDTERFVASEPARARLRAQWNIAPSTPVCVIVGAMRREKNHARFLRIAARASALQPDLRFVIVGDGPQRLALEQLAKSLQLQHRVSFLGTRLDVPEILAAADVFLLTSDIEACPVTILEAMACELPVIASHVGSIPEVIQDGVTGYALDPTDEVVFCNRLIRLTDEPDRARRMGRAGRNRVIQIGSRDAMVEGYTCLLERLYSAKVATAPSAEPTNVEQWSQLLGTAGEHMEWRF